MKRRILWWGRFDPDYSRNRILRKLLLENNISLGDFKPRSSFLGSLESMLVDPGPANAIWVPCFRQRDLQSAKRYADKLGVKLIFDPLISSWDKIVFERKKFPAGHRRAARLMNWEKSLFSQADIVIADTKPHGEFFQQTLSAPADSTFVIPVGAEESVFAPQPDHHPKTTPEILFFGSFINLQGPDHIVAAARLVPDVQWTLVGDGPLRSRCESLAQETANVRFEEWCAYEKLAERIGKADILLGIFGDSPKSSRVIPNKVYQALACGRPVITRSSEAYPSELTMHENGIWFVPPASPEALGDAVTNLLLRKNHLQTFNNQARKTYETWFSERQINAALGKVLALLDITT